MSSFFRQASEISQSEDTTTSSHVEPSTSSISLSTQDNQLITQDAASVATRHHQNVLVHALLEEKCLNDVCNELNASRDRATTRPFTKTDRHVVTRARERYKALAAQLSSHGLLSVGLDADDLGHVRQTARDGLDLLSQNLGVLNVKDGNEAHSTALQQPLQRLLTQRPGAMEMLAANNAWACDPTPGLASQLLPSHPLLDSTRYVRDFEEVCLLGKGGYGRVYHVNHRLDGRSYAVKKVVLSPAVVRRVRLKGQGELDELLAELRTMAKLEHPNIVRYFGGWVEWSRPDGHSETERGHLIENEQSATLTSTDDESSPGQRLIRSPFSVDAVAGAEDNVLFENSSTSHHSKTSDHTVETLSASSPSTRLHHTRTRSTHATASDEAEIEEIARNPSPPLHSTTTSTDPPLPPTTTSPALTLHIQMSLYPLTLSRYISNPTHLSTADGATHTLQHCFHPPAARDALLAVLAGVEHLHEHGIAHRDLKPANIFLAPRALAPSPSHSHSGPVLPGRHCCAPLTGGARRMHLAVCIGDFGLVRDVSAGPDGRAVGTQLYRPPPGTAGGGGVGQDVFALGIVLAELLCRFGTRMERLHVLCGMRDGEGEAFGAAGMEGAVVRRILEVGKGREEGGLADVRAWVSALGEGAGDGAE